MTLKLSKDWSVASIIIGCLIIIVNCAIFYTATIGGFTAGDEVLVLVALVYNIGLAFLLYEIYPYCAVLHFNEDNIKAVIFKKEYCIINRNEKIYYKFFIASENSFQKKEYIMISNSPFSYNFEKKSLVHLSWIFHHYDKEKEIILPSNNQVVKFTEDENWISI